MQRGFPGLPGWPGSGSGQRPALPWVGCLLGKDPFLRRPACTAQNPTPRLLSGFQQTLPFGSQSFSSSLSLRGDKPPLHTASGQNFHFGSGMACPNCSFFLVCLCSCWSFLFSSFLSVSYAHSFNILTISGAAELGAVPGLLSLGLCVEEMAPSCSLRSGSPVTGSCRESSCSQVSIREALTHFGGDSLGKKIYRRSEALAAGRALPCGRHHQLPVGRSGKGQGLGVSVERVIIGRRRLWGWQLWG